MRSGAQSVSRRTFIRIGCAASAVPVLAMLEACSVAVPAPASAPTSSGTGPPGRQQVGDLTIALDSFGFEQWELKQMQFNDDGAYGATIYDTLLWVDKDNKLVSGIANSWEQSSDGLSWTFKLRSDMKFHDGSAVTSDDVVFSLNQMMAPDSRKSSAAVWRNNVDSIDAPNSATVVIKTKQVWSDMPTSACPLVGLESAVMSKAYFQKVGAAAYRDAPLGTGPYRFGSRVAGSQMVLEAVPSHPFRPTSAFKRLILKLITDESSKMAGMQTGDIDVSVISLDAIPRAQSAGLTLNYIPAMTMAAVGFWDAWDTRSIGKPTSDTNVRKALAMAINSDELIKTLWAGHATKAEGNVPNLWPGDAAPFARPAIPFDPPQAQQLIQQSGFNGFDIKLYTFPFAGVPWLGKLAEAVAGYWNRIGVSTQIVSTDFASMTQLFNTQVPSEQLLGNAFTVPYFWIANVATWNANQYSGNTASGFRNILDPTVTDAFRKAVAARDDNARVAALRQGAQIIYDSYTIPAVALVDTAIATGKRVSSVSPQPQVNFLSMWFNSVGQA